MATTLRSAPNRGAFSENTVIADRFRIIGPAAGGGMGVVYRAHDLETDGQVAIKVALSDDNAVQRARFEREARALSQLSHPNIVPYVAHGRAAGGAPYLAMQWLEGCDLFTYIRRNPLNEAQTLEVARQLCSALAAVHDKGIVHRDIKPANIFLVDDDIERLCLIDFGLARIESMPTGLTMSGSLVGTPAFIAPEQASNEMPADARVDLYALGAVMFACLVGTPPFIGRQVLAVLTKVLLEPAPRVSELCTGVSPGLDELIAGLLAKEPEERPSSADELLALLAGLEDGPDGAFGTVAGGADSPARVAALSHRENQFFTVLLVESSLEAGDELLLETIAVEAAGTHCQVHRMANGAIVGVFSTDSAPVEMAAAAARCALLIHQERPEVAMTVATGRGTLDERAPVGEVIDRAVGLLFHREQGGDGAGGARKAADVSKVVIDEVTAGLIARRFELRSGPESSFILRGEGGHDRISTQLLGRDTPFVGRRREMAAISAIFDECVAESAPRAVLVTGAEGTGKSRLCRELSQLLEDGDGALTVWAAYGDPGLAGASFGLLGQILRGAMGVAPTQSLSERRERIRHDVGLRFAGSEAERVAAFLGEIIATPFPDDNFIRLEEARHDPRLMHDQMRQAWEDWVEAQSREQPILCVLDDLQWGDLPTIRYLDAALRNLSDSPFMVLALATPKIYEKFHNLWLERDVEQIPLRPLSKKACSQLARRVLPDKLADNALQTLVEQCAGNPFYLEELLRHAARGEQSELPETILATASRRLRELSPHDRRVLRAASTFGRRFWVEGVAALLDESTTTVEAALTHLQDRELVVRERRSRFPDYQAYAFRHSVLREAAYATFTREDQLRAHHRAGLWLQSIGEAEPMVLAEHYWLGGVPEQAGPCYRRAAEQALEADDVQAVIDRAERAVECGAKGQDLGALRLLQAEAHNWKAEHENACGRGEAAMQYLSRDSDGWAHAAHQTSWASYSIGDVTRIASVTRELIDYISESPSDTYLASMVICGGHAALVKLQEQAAEIQGIVARHRQDRAPGPLLAGTIARVNGFLASFEGRWGDTAAFMVEAVEIWSELGNERSACNDEVNLACALSQLGEYAQSIAVLQSCVERARRVGTNVRAFCDSAMAVARARNGEMDTARALFDNLVADEGSKYLEGMNWVYRSWFAWLDGNAARACELAARASGTVDRNAFAQVFVFANAIRALGLLDLGRPKEALDVAREGMEVLEPLGRLDEGDMLLRLAHARALYANGEVAQAARSIQMARRELMSRAQAIANPRWRDSFLHRVAEHESILELAHDWTGPGASHGSPDVPSHP